jgi:hypothetical protein
MYYEVFKIEPGAREKAQIHRRDIHRTSQSQANGIDNSRT